jgi:hypothetical protein
MGRATRSGSRLGVTESGVPSPQAPLLPVLAGTFFWDIRWQGARLLVVSRYFPSRSPAAEWTVVDVSR